MDKIKYTVSPLTNTDTGKLDGYMIHRHTKGGKKAGVIHDGNFRWNKKEAQKLCKEWNDEEQQKRKAYERDTKLRTVMKPKAATTQWEIKLPEEAQVILTANLSKRQYLWHAIDAATGELIYDELNVESNEVTFGTPCSVTAAAMTNAIQDQVLELINKNTKDSEQAT